MNLVHLFDLAPEDALDGCMQLRSEDVPMGCLSERSNGDSFWRLLKPADRVANLH